MKKLFCLLVVTIILLFACKEEPPTQVDGKAILKVIAVWDTSTVDGIQKFMPLANAKVIIASEYGPMVKYTQADGTLLVDKIPSSTYSVSVRMQHPEDQSIYIVGNVADIEVNSGSMVEDTVFAQAISSTGIALNEIYCGGPVNNIFYFYDQFLELYNSSDSVKYLDGMRVYRVSGNNDGKGPGADEHDDGDIDGATYIFKFPGSYGEKNYPFPPKTFLVLAGDAVDHRNSIATSIDLSNADWEFFNQYSANDIDNPNVPNLSNERPDRTVDFMINLVSDVIVISDGRDTVWVDGIDIDTILDAVEYQSNGTYTLTLDNRLDRGYIDSPPKYGGKSMQRREPGVDTNNGTLDWETIDSPTPGYHK